MERKSQPFNKQGRITRIGSGGANVRSALKRRRHQPFVFLAMRRWTTSSSEEWNYKGKTTPAVLLLSSKAHAFHKNGPVSDISR